MKGRRKEIEQRRETDQAEGQFGIADERSPLEVSEKLRALGLDPVWKDWDPAILGGATSEPEAHRRLAGVAAAAGVVD